ncbi:MAG: efflux RND transporter permease subunit [Candidatus Competibacteraceae bacterium]|nr:efflux RND transporter permease subunit [Candidatus Competibacteraceae bacterium]
MHRLHDLSPNHDPARGQQPFGRGGTLGAGVAAVLGLIPLAIAAGEPGKEILQPMAVVMLAGLVSSTLLDLIYTPAFFWRWCGPVAKRLAKGGEVDFVAA